MDEGKIEKIKINKEIKPEKPEKDKKYKVMTPEEVASYKEWVKQKIKQWRNEFRPDYIAVTETTATPLGFLIKSAWKEAYTDESTPRFLRVDPIQIRNNLDSIDRAIRVYRMQHENATKAEVEEEFKRVKAKYFEKYFKSISCFPHDEKTRLLALDECSEESADRVATLIRDGWNLTGDNIKAEGSMPEGYIIAPAASFPRDYNLEDGRVRPTVKRSSNSKNPTSLNIDMGYNLRGRIVPGKKYIASARAFINDIKLAGREAGQELRVELEKESDEDAV